MLLISGRSHPKLAANIAKGMEAPFYMCRTTSFPDGELRLQIFPEMEEENVVLIQSTCPPTNDHLMELFLMADTAKRAGAHRICAIIPYFGYGRQDRVSYHQGPLSANLIARFLETSGIDRVITIDLHSKHIESFFQNKVINLEPSFLFLPYLKELQTPTVIAPDMGGILRARNLATLLKSPLGVLNKVRTSTGKCQIESFFGNIQGKDCILVDDILATGETLLQGAALLDAAGARSITACVSHGVLCGEAIAQIQASNIMQCLILDTIPQPSLPDKFKVISSIPLLLSALKKRNKEDSS